jgi:hypothetical protein
LQDVIGYFGKRDFRVVKSLSWQDNGLDRELLFLAKC